MALFKRKQKHHRRKETFRQTIREIDWSISPNVFEEIVAVALVIFGAILVLSLFGLAGPLGKSISSILFRLWGIFGGLIPFAILSFGILSLLGKKRQIKASAYLGVVLSFLFLPALFSDFGGLIGTNIARIISKYVGPVATIIILTGLSLTSLLVIFNVSLKDFLGKFNFRWPEKNKTVIQSSEPTVSVFATVKNKIGGALNKTAQEKPAETQTALKFSRDANWIFPPFDLLEYSQTKAASGNIAKNVEIIQKTLKDFGVEVAMGEVNIGPTVTQYSLKPSEGIKLNQITARQNDLSLSLAAHPLRIEAPIPGKSAVGVEIPNKVRANVTLREIIETPEYKNTKSNLVLGLGRDVAGAPIIVNLERMPHLLIAGSTGSGKSICINGIILTLLYSNSPEELRLILVDPKRVEFTNYNGVPHLLAPVVTEPDKTVNVLRWAVAEMERRFKLFAQDGSRDIISYNQKHKNPLRKEMDIEKIEQPEEEAAPTKLPYIVIIIDELADLMAQSANEVEGAIVRLAQMARATGIHLIVATQRPSVDVITGLIKANITTRIAFAVASQIDSRTIIDSAGAEKLLGNGDMLYLGTDFNGKPKRIQGIMVIEKEIRNVTDFLRREREAIYDESILAFGAPRTTESGEMIIDDDLFDEAKQTVIQAGKASASLLQRRLRVGYARAARLLDLLESEGIIGPPDGAKPRDVLAANSTDFNNTDYHG